MVYIFVDERNKTYIIYTSIHVDKSHTGITKTKIGQVQCSI